MKPAIRFLAVTSLVVFARLSHASAIDPSAFVAPVVDYLNGLSSTGQIFGPLVRPEGTFTVSGGVFRYQEIPFGVIGTDSATGSVDLVLSTPTHRVGAWTGASALTVSFFDVSDNLLGIVNTPVPNPFVNDGFSFAGWEDATPIAHVVFSDNDAGDGKVLFVSRVTVETANPVPLPAPALLLGVALGGLGVMRRRAG